MEDHKGALLKFSLLYAQQAQLPQPSFIEDTFQPSDYLYNDNVKIDWSSYFSHHLSALPWSYGNVLYDTAAHQHIVLWPSMWKT